jgi:hypothetical protein
LNVQIWLNKTEQKKLLLLICKILFNIFRKKVIMRNENYNFLNNVVKDIPDENNTNKKSNKKKNKEELEE